MSLFSIHESAAGSEIQELKRMLCRLNASDAQTRLAVGMGAQLANAEFIRKFGGFEAFHQLPSEAQKTFCSELSDLELGLREREPGVSLGVGLYRIWLDELLGERRNLSEMLGRELSELSRRAASA